MAGGRIFINYRREDSRGDARSLFERLNTRFPKQIFMDVSKLEPGEDFVEAIEREVASCHALIVLIGKQWLSLVAADGRRRLDDPHDFVRLEISAALKRKALVIPSLVGGASMPSADVLPEDLQPLTRRQALQITDQDWDHDVARLVQVLERALGATLETDHPTDSPQESAEISAPRRRAREAMARGDRMTAIAALRECLAENPNDEAAAAELRGALQQEKSGHSPPLPQQPTSEPGIGQMGGQHPQVPLNPATLVGRWQLKESQTLVQAMGFMDLFPNYQFQVWAQGVVAMAGFWGCNPLAGTLELQGQNLYGVGFRGSLSSRGAQFPAFSGTCMDALGNTWLWELLR